MAAPVRLVGRIEFFIFLCLNVLGSHSLYEDQVGKFDWRQQYIGQVKHVQFDQPSGHTNRKVIVSTHKNVLAALNAKNGQIVWRQLLEEDTKGRVDVLLPAGENVIAVCGGGMYIRSFSTALGHLVWEQSLAMDTQMVATAKMVGNGEFIAVLSGKQVHLLKTSSGKIQWSKDLPNSDVVAYKYLHVNNMETSVIGVVPSSHVTIATYSDEGNLDNQRSVTAAWMLSDTSCVITDSGHMTCVDPTVNVLYTVAVDSGDTFESTLLLDLGVTGNSPKLQSVEYKDNLAVVLDGAHHVLFSVGGGNVRLLKDLPQVSVLQVLDTSDGYVLMTVGRQDSEHVLIQCYDINSLQLLPEYTHTSHLAQHHGNPIQISGVFLKKRDRSQTYRVALASEDHSIVMLQQSGKMLWSREEALASILSVEMVDLPVSENQAKYEDEFGSREGDIAAMFLNRLKTQLSQVQTFLLNLQLKLKGHRHHYVVEDAEFNEDSELTRDEFNLHKMIVAVTESGKIFGVDSARGDIVWRHFLPDLVFFDHNGKKVAPLYVRRTTAHFPNPPQCVVIGKHKTSGNGLLYQFNPISGFPSDGTPAGGADLGYQVLQVSMLQITDDHFVKGLMIMDPEHKIHVYPSFLKTKVMESAGSIFLFNADVNTGLVTGFGVGKDQGDSYLHGQEVWSINIPKSTQTITQVVGKRSIEHVHSQGKPLADRSVLYKYINPNLVALVAEGEENTQKGVFGMFSVYLLDAVSGEIVFHTTHKKARGPVHLVHSENWIVYHYWNQKVRRDEMAVLELYEGLQQSNATAFSSLHPPPPPLVMRQSYILPLGVSALGVTITEIGITSKSILMVHKCGTIAEVSKQMVDPRRPIDPTPEAREEGIPPYIPELLIPYEAMINYNQTVSRIHGVQTAPAGLESTSLVLAYGLDLYFTKVTPSNMFDVLKEDFDYFFISTVLIGMIIVSIVSQKLASRKALARAWK